MIYEVAEILSTPRTGLKVEVNSHFEVVRISYLLKRVGSSYPDFLDASFPNSSEAFRVQGFLIDWLASFDSHTVALPTWNYGLGKAVQGTEFQKKVWKAMTEIPAGDTRTYGELAQLVGSEKAARAVGGACGENPWPLLVPCHRVVASNGLGGFIKGLENGLTLKEKLLKIEGVDPLALD